MEKISNCWLEIGVWGNGSCDLLKQNIHCANCAKFEEAGAYLFERETPEGYLEEWNEILSKTKENNYYYEKAYLIFRINYEWFAIQIKNITYITELKTIHSLPGKTNTLLKGLTNIRGELKIVFDIYSLLNVDKNETYIEEKNKKIYKRMCVFSVEKEVWVFVADEILGIKKIQDSLINQVPVTVKKSSSNFMKGIIKRDDNTFIGVLDENKMFTSINKNVY